MLKLLTPQEVIARAYALYLKRVRQGKTSKRVVLTLPPNELPPLTKGEIDSPFGVIKISAAFVQREGKWYITVRFPQDSGFQIKDHLPQQPSQQP